MTIVTLQDARVEGIFREAAWKYFEIHAEQRLKLFQFYITICTALLAAGALAARLEGPNILLAIVGVFSVLISLIFWRLDARTKILVKIGENALKTLDNLHVIPDTEDGGPSPLKLFERDDFLAKEGTNSFAIVGHVSYRKCFNATFLFVCLMGLLAIMYGLGLLAPAHASEIGAFKALTLFQ